MSWPRLSNKRSWQSSHLWPGRLRLKKGFPQKNHQANSPNKIQRNTATYWQRVTWRLKASHLLSIFKLSSVSIIPFTTSHISSNWTLYRSLDSTSHPEITLFLAGECIRSTGMFRNLNNVHRKMKAFTTNWHKGSKLRRLWLLRTQTHKSVTFQSW